VSSPVIQFTAFHIVIIKTDIRVVVSHSNFYWFRQHMLHVSAILAILRYLTLRRLMSYIYGAPILDVSRSHTTTQHSR